VTNAVKFVEDLGVSCDRVNEIEMYFECLDRAKDAY
jgi:hypothetical protein